MIQIIAAGLSFIRAYRERAFICHAAALMRPLRDHSGQVRINRTK